MSTETHQTDVSVIDLINFILKHNPPMRDWNPITMINWIAFHQEQQFLIATSADGLTISGLAIARPIMSPMDSFEHYVFDNEGPTVYVDLLIARGNETMRALVTRLVQRFGVRESVAWNRRGKHKLIVRPAGRVIRKILKKGKPANVSA